MRVWTKPRPRPASVKKKKNNQTGTIEGKINHVAPERPELTPVTARATTLPSPLCTDSKGFFFFSLFRGLRDCVPGKRRAEVEVDELILRIPVPNFPDESSG